MDYSAWGHKELDTTERLSLKGMKVETEGLEGLELYGLLKVNKGRLHYQVTEEWLGHL